MKTGSSISNIFSSYRDSLTYSQGRYADLYNTRTENALQFYEDFLHTLILNFNSFEDDSLRRLIRSDMRRFFNSDEIQFVSIDGSCGKDPFSDFMVFSSIAYGVRGEIGLQGDPPHIKYKRRSMDEDVSFVAYVPVPFAEIEDVANSERLEDFIASDQDKIDLSNIHTPLMQLAEVYLAYEVARSSAPDRARLILLDHSPSSILASTEVGTEKIGMLNHVKVGRTCITPLDATIVYAHPFNEGLELPSAKRFRLYNALIEDVVRKRVGKFGGPAMIDMKRFAQEKGITLDDWKTHYQRNSRAIGALGKYDSTNETFTPRSDFDYDESWRTSVRLFEEICYKLFKAKDQTALTYAVKDEYGEWRQRWMSPEDVKFIIAIGMRALIEICWERRVFLLGIVKDSQSRYFTRNYYGVMRFMELYDSIDVKPLPWTDRIVLENVAREIASLSAPWTTIEFDSCFMTLHLEQLENGQVIPRGVRGDIVNQERLFARSLGQFFLRRKTGKSFPLMGHVIFIDRLLQPDWDEKFCNTVEITSSELGSIKPFVHATRDHDNPGQRMAMYLLDTLTRNLFPEAIGYPDPLHKADWGAKTVQKQVARIIGDSEISFRANPLSKSFRRTRDEHNR